MPHKKLFIRPIVTTATLFLLLTLSACSFFRAPGKVDCDKLLSKEQMTAILSEIYLLESFLSEYQHIQRGVLDSAAYYYAGIFEHHQVAPEVFEEALYCYLLDRKEMDEIHEKILNDLSLMESESQQ